MDLSTAEGQPAWKKLVQSLHSGKTVLVDDRKYLLRELLADNKDGNRVFLVQRMSGESKSDELSVLKVSYHLHTHDRHFILSVEQKALELQGQRMRAPKVHYLSVNGMVMEKEFIKGTLFEDWFQAGDSERDRIGRMFTLLRFLQKVRESGLSFGDAHQRNILAEDATGELVIFDPGTVRVREEGEFGLSHPGGVFSKITNSGAYSYFLFWLAKYYFERIGDNERSMKKLMEVVKALGHDTPSIFKSLYAIDKSFSQAYPAEYEYLLEVARGEFYSTMYSTEQKNLNVDGTVVPATKQFMFWLREYVDDSSLGEEPRSQFIGHVTKYKLPGLEYLKYKKLTPSLGTGLFTWRSRCEVAMFGESKYP